MEIPLRAKYKVGGYAKQVHSKTGGDGKLGNGKSHHKVTDKERRLLKPQPLMMMMVGPTGKRRMVRL